jgi:hypothetical protein
MKQQMTIWSIQNKLQILPKFSQIDDFCRIDKDLQTFTE